jgi:flagellin
MAASASSAVGGAHSYFALYTDLIATQAALTVPRQRAPSDAPTLTRTGPAVGSFNSAAVAAPVGSFRPALPESSTVWDAISAYVIQATLHRNPQPTVPNADGVNRTVHGRTGPDPNQGGNTMGLRINQNIAAMNAYRNLSVTDGQMAKSLEKLSSGYRINRAADDAAGLAISEGLRSQVGGLKVAVRNAQDGISVVQTAEGALTETHSILQRMRDLAVQSASDSNDADSRTAIQTEATSLNSELDRIAGKTTYNNIKLLDGSFASQKVQVGYASNDNISVTIAGGATAANNIMNTDATHTGSTITTGGTITFSQADDAETALTKQQVGAVSVTTGTLATTTTAQGTVDALNADVNFSTAFTASLDSTTGGLKVSSKTGNSSAVTFTLNGATAGLTSASSNAALATGGGFSSADLGVNAVALGTQTGANSAMTTIDSAIKMVSKSRADLGALQNRFEHTINNLNVAVENLSASESRIRDVDMAQEMVNFTRSQILSQAGTSMLSQANQAPQSVLSLLR